MGIAEHCHLRYTDTRFLTSGFFHESASSRALIVGLQPFRIFMSIDGDISTQMFLCGVKDTAEKF